MNHSHILHFHWKNLRFCGKLDTVTFGVGECYSVLFLSGKGGNHNLTDILVEENFGRLA